MGRIVTLRPNAGGSGGMNYNVFGGGGADWVALSDNDDGSWVQMYSGSPYSVVDVNLNSYGLGANERCAAVRAIGRWDSGNGNTNMYVQIVDGLTGNQGAYGYYGGNYSAGLGTYWGPWANARPTGGEWVQGSIDALRWRASDANNGTTLARHTEAYVDLDIRVQPTVSITSPTAGQKFFSQQPTVQWNTNSQGDTANAYQVRIFTAAVVTGGGFNADTSTSVDDSGRVGGTASSRQVAVPLAYGGSYYAHIKVANDFNGTDWWSNWTSVQFSINNPASVSAVTVTPATPITTTNRPTIGWTYTDTDGDVQDVCYVRVFPEAAYSAGGFNPGADAGATWVSGVATQNIASGALGSAQTGVLSPNVNYKAYVWVAEVGSNQRWSAQAVSGVFTITTAPGTVADPPAVPEVISATADTPNQRVVLAVQARGNILTRNQASGDTGTIGWEPDANLSSANLTRDTTTFLQGGAAFKMVPTTNGTDMAMRTTRVGSAGVFPVTPLRTYTAVGSSRSASTARASRLLIRWYDGGGALISTITGTSVNDSSTAFTQVTASGSAPSTAATAELVAQNLVPSEPHYWDNLGLAPGTSTTWSRGGFAVELGNLSDAFSRADSATTLGTADIGGAWSALAGTWGISGNRGYMASATSPGMAVLTSTHLSDGYVQADITLSATANRADCGLLFHALDVNNVLLVELVKTATADTISLVKRVAGTWTSLVTVAGAGLINGTTYTVRVEFYGGQVFVYVNNALRLSYLMLSGELAQFGTYAKYGIYVDNAAAKDDGGSRFDNFVAKLPKTQIVTLERSTDGELTWAAVRNAKGVALNDQLGTFYDYEGPPGILAHYRLRTTGSEAGVSYSSPNSASVVQSALITISNWMLKDPIDPTLNIVLTVVPPFTFQRKEPQSIFDPMGRNTSVVITDGAKGIDGTLTVWTKTKAQYDALGAILSNGRTLMLQDPFGRSWYIKVGDAQSWQLIRATPAPGETTPLRHLHQVALPFTEVSAPAVV